MAIKFSHRGNFDRTEKFLKKSKNKDYRAIFEKYGNIGLERLRANTPKDSGVTAESWNYEISYRKGRINICWTNSHFNGGLPIVILIQYGHGTTGGTFVEGRDFINPAMKPVFDEIAENLWKEVDNL